MTDWFGRIGLALAALLLASPLVMAQQLVGASGRIDLVAQIGHAENLRGMAIAPNGQWLATVDDNVVKLWARLRRAPNRDRGSN